MTTKTTPLLDEVLRLAAAIPKAPRDGLAHPFGIKGAGWYWVMSERMAQEIAEQAGITIMSMRGTRLLGLPVLFSQIEGLLLAVDDPDALP